MNIKYNSTISVPVLKHHFMRTYGRMGKELHPFINLALDEGEFQLKAPASLPPKKESVAMKEKFLIKVRRAYSLAKEALLENMNTASRYAF
jgi:hypothetical protein